MAIVAPHMAETKTSNGRSLVIVESPAKAKTIAGYLGDGLHGRVVDRPHPRPAAQRRRGARRRRSRSRGRASASTSTPISSRSTSSTRRRRRSSRACARSSRTPTSSCSRRTKTARARRSPGISSQVLKPKVPVRRMVFHEITQERDRAGPRRDARDRRPARRRAGDAPHPRPALRLRGLARALAKVMKGLSAGRVQSVATRLVVERERERMRSSPPSTGTSSARSTRARSTARLAARRRPPGRPGPRLRPQRDAAPTQDAVQLDEATARGLAAALDGAPFAVRSVERQPYTRRPAAPFMTSTLQQEASRKLRFSAQQTMRIAQRLYENGYITYMRTDSTSLSESAIAAARDQARELYGAEAVPAAAAPLQPKGQERAGGARGDPPRRRPLPHARRGARRARRATRPRSTTSSGSAPSPRRWPTRAARPSRSRLGATAADGRDAEFGTAGTVITFRGFMLAYEEGRDEAAAGDEEEKPPAAARRGRRARGAPRSSPRPLDHRRRARYTEATLVRALEERGIGRPSTYASILGTILDRGYVRKDGQALVPTFLAFAVTNLLEQHFSRLVDYEFTARMEDDLDRIASGDGAAERLAAPLLLRRTATPEEGLKALVSDLGRHRRARDQHDRDRQRDRAAHRPLRPLHRARTASAPRSPTTSLPTS